uniref:H(+)-exporting diphosphatase n=1 Tax=Chenopodium quinoa TaxID=63459 RepID=A0A803MG76_CHEQI
MLTCCTISSFGINHEFTAILYPLLISSVGIIVCLITTLFATDFFEIKAVKEIEPALKKQLVISTALMIVAVAVISWVALPSSFTIFDCGTLREVKNWQLFLCVAVGLWAGFIIRFVTEYYTSNAYIPVQDVTDSYRTRAATNVIFGLALGYKSVIIPIFIAVSVFVSFSFAAMYGIAEMAGMSHIIRERTDALDAAGNTTAAIRKGFAIGSAALVSLALFGAFIPGLMEGTTKPDYANCVKISTDASIKEMIPPAALVMLTPLIVGNLFGVETLSGSLLSGVQAGASEHAMSLGPKGSDAHKAAVIGDTIGDPLKDTSGPSLNILIKLIVVESLVFASFFATHGGLLFKIF